MKPAQHVVISSGVGLVLAWWIQSAAAGLACFLSGVFIDIDHYLDFYLEKKKIPFRYKELTDFCNRDNKDRGRLRLIFHSYEFLVVLWLAVSYWHLNELWLGFAVGLSQHLVCDQLTNPFRPLAYFLAYRLKYGFQKEYIFL